MSLYEILLLASVLLDATFALLRLLEFLSEKIDRPPAPKHMAPKKKTR